MIHLKLTLVEQVLFGTLVLAVFSSAYFSVQGEDAGGNAQIRLAKIQAQQELMAQRPDRP